MEILCLAAVIVDVDRDETTEIEGSTLTLMQVVSPLLLNDCFFLRLIV